MSDVDVAILGAGVAGCIAAIALAPSQRVLLLDKQAKPAVRIGECLPPVARRILRQLSLTAPISAGGHLNSQGMHAYWGSDQAYVVDHLRNPDGFGWHLDRQRFEVSLREAAKARGVEHCWPEKITHSEYANHRWLLTTRTQGSVSAKFVIDAGGRQSPFARQQGIRRQHSDRLLACWATLDDATANAFGLITASEDGWWYSAPLPDNRRVISLQTDADLVDHRCKKHLSALLQQAEQCAPLAKVLRTCTLANAVHRGATAAGTTRLGVFSGKSWAAIGDAAISLDPLSSQGMYNAMASAMQLAALLIGGEAGISTLHHQQTERVWAHYQQHRALYYQQEQRWPQRPFWRRRQTEPHLSRSRVFT